MVTARYTTEEIVESLKRTSIKTIVVEGNDDMEALRDLETRISRASGPVSFYPAGDKASVLKIASQKPAFGKATVSFLADSDLWLFTDEKAAHPDVVFTNGYSIENLCIACPNLKHLIDARPATVSAWENALSGLSDWFASEAAYYLNGENPRLDIGIRLILSSENNFDLTPNAKIRISNSPKTIFCEVKAIVQGNPLKFIRGKQLFLALSEVLEKQDGNRISIKTLRSLGSRLPNPAIDALIADLVVSLTLE